MNQAVLAAELGLYIGQVLVLLLASICHLAAAIMASRGMRLVGRCLLVLAGIALLASMICRSLYSGHLPFSSLYEFNLLLGFSLIGLCLFFDLRHPRFNLAAVLAPLCFILAAIGLLLFNPAAPLLPVLRSAWLFFHVLTAVAAYGLFAGSFALAVLARIGLATRREILASPQFLEGLVSRLVLLGFPFLTLLIVSGAIWAEFAWGAFWRWDPKETWALVTWLLYLVYLHLVRGRKLQGRLALDLAIVGFLVVLFSFFGVNLLLKGLHSYA